MKHNLKIKEKTFYALYTLAKSESLFKKKSIFKTLAANPNCPIDVVKGMLLDKTGLSEEFFKQIHSNHVTDQSINLLLEAAPEELKSMFYFQTNVPLKYLRAQKKFLKNKKREEQAKEVANLSYIKDLASLIELVDLKLSNSPSAKDKTAAIF